MPKEKAEQLDGDVGRQICRTSYHSLGVTPNRNVICSPKEVQQLMKLCIL